MNVCRDQFLFSSFQRGNNQNLVEILSLQRSVFVSNRVVLYGESRGGIHAISWQLGIVVGSAMNVSQPDAEIPLVYC